MRKIALSGLLLATLLPAPVFAQGSGGYYPGCHGAETVRMSGEERERARAEHRTNDTSGGFSSIDKSCQTWEGGGTTIGPVPGTVHFGSKKWGFGGAHTGN